MKIATIIGARPQFIKASVVCRAADKQQGINEVLIHTGQHFSPNMSDVFFEDLNIRQPDYNLEIGGGTHGQNTGRMIESIEDIFTSNISRNTVNILKATKEIRSCKVNQ